MSGLTHDHPDVAALMRRLRTLGYMTPSLMTEVEARAIYVLERNGFATTATRDRRLVWEPTVAGKTWTEGLS